MGLTVSPVGGDFRACRSARLRCAGVRNAQGAACTVSPRPPLLRSLRRDPALHQLGCLGHLRKQSPQFLSLQIQLCVPKSGIAQILRYSPLPERARSMSPDLSEPASSESSYRLLHPAQGPHILMGRHNCVSFSVAFKCDLRESPSPLCSLQVTSRSGHQGSDV